MLVVSGKRAVGCDDGPTVAKLLNFVGAGADHRFYGKRHSGNEARTPSGLSVVRYFGILVKLMSYC